VKSDPKQPSYKKVLQPQKGYFEKDVETKVVSRNGCDGRPMAKILIVTI